MKTNPRQEIGLNQSDMEFASLGFYEPGFIHLRVNTHEDLKTGLHQLLHTSSPPEWAGTFLHEYIHFLQDITSTHGLLNFIHVIDYLKNANKQVIEGVLDTFTIPLIVSNAFNLHTNNKLKEIYRGREGNAQNIRYLSYRRTNEKILNSKSEVIEVPKHYVDYYDNRAQTSMTCHFGSIHLKEYMAHAVQTKFDPTKVHDDLPYRLVELLVESEVPSLAMDSALIVALCDASLMDYHPTQLFLRTIERMKAAPGRIPTDVGSIYNFTYEDLRPGEHVSFDSLYVKTADVAVGHFRDSLKGDVFKNTVQWFEALVAAAIEVRLNSRGFFTRLVSSAGVVSPEFVKVVETFGIPFTTNENSSGCYIPPASLGDMKFQPYLPKVFQAIVKTYQGSNRCSLHPFCEADNGFHITSSDCLSQPWARVNFPDLCPYAQLWKTWGLLRKAPASSCE